MKTIASIFACVFASLITATLASAQVAPATPPATPLAAGLDSLSEDRVLAELANRGLTSLLERAFVINKVPPDKQESWRTVAALAQLGDRNARLSPRAKQELIAKSVRGMAAAIPSMTDPDLLWKQATLLLENGVERDAKTLEYWGESPRTQAALRPVVETVIALLDKCAAEAQKRADAVANTINNPNDPKAKQWEQLSMMATTAAYTRHMVDYYLALSQDKIAPARKEVAAKAVEFLSQYDNAESTLQPKIRLLTAKLKMTRGDFDEAKAIFKSLYDRPDKIQPPPDKAQQWEARYFSAVADLLAGNADAAQKQLESVTAWQKTNLPTDQPTQDAADSLSRMLQYRIESLRAEQAKDDATRKAANDRAVAILLDLVKRRPEYQRVIFEQLTSRLPANVDLKAQDALMLQGFVQRADDERNRPENERADPRVLEQGIAAAKELTARKGQPGIDPQVIDTSNLLIGFFLDRLNRPADAAEAFLDYVQNYGGNPRNAQLALDNAQALIAKLRADKVLVDDPKTVHAYERFLSIAIKPPFNRTQFAYDYARRLVANRKPKEAIEYFRMMPADDKRLTSARFFEMAALQQRLDQEKLDPTERQTLVADFQRLINDVMQRCAAAISAPTTSQAERDQYRSMLARTHLLASDVARRDQNDPKRTLALLKGFETLAAGLPNEQELLSSALYTRVQANMQLGQTDEATRTLVELLKSKGGGEGLSIVANLFQKLTQELERARQAGDRNRMKVLASNRAQLSGFLVEWAKKNPDPNINKYAYRYSVVDAATKHLAAELVDDPAARKAGLSEALKLYKQLESPESAALYQASLEPSQRTNPPYPDPAVSLGIGLISYDIGDYAEAQRRLGQLLTDRKLGTATINIDDNGQPKTVDNDQYWEATFKLLRCNILLASAASANDPQAAETKQRTQNYLKQLYVQWGTGVGGKKWNAEFEKLRAEIIPDFKPSDFAVEATQPVAGQ